MVCRIGTTSAIILYSFSAHLTDAVLEKLSKNSICTVIVSSGCTSILQPLETSLNKPFKAMLRQLWQKCILDNAEVACRSPNLPIKLTCWHPWNYCDMARTSQKSWCCEDELIRNDELKGRSTASSILCLGGRPSKWNGQWWGGRPLGTDSEDSTVT